MPDRPPSLRAGCRGTRGPSTPPSRVSSFPSPFLAFCSVLDRLHLHFDVCFGAQRIHRFPHPFQMPILERETCRDPTDCKAFALVLILTRARLFFSFSIVLTSPRSKPPTSKGSAFGSFLPEPRSSSPARRKLTNIPRCTISDVSLPVCLGAHVLTFLFSMRLACFGTA